KMQVCGLGPHIAESFLKAIDSAIQYGGMASDQLSQPRFHVIPAVPPSLLVKNIKPVQSLFHAMLPAEIRRASKSEHALAHHARSFSNISADEKVSNSGL